MASRRPLPQRQGGRACGNSLSFPSLNLCGSATKWFESVPLSFPLHCREHPPRTVLNGRESPCEAFIPQPRRAGGNRYGNWPRPHPLVGFAQAPTEVGRRKRKSRLCRGLCGRLRQRGDGSDLRVRPPPSPTCEAGLGLGGGSGVEGVYLATYRWKGMGRAGGGGKHFRG